MQGIVTWHEKGREANQGVVRQLAPAESTFTPGLHKQREEVILAVHNPRPPRQELEPEQACPVGAIGWKGLEDAAIHGDTGGRHTLLVPFPSPSDLPLVPPPIDYTQPEEGSRPAGVSPSALQSRAGERQEMGLRHIGLHWCPGEYINILCAILCDLPELQGLNHSMGLGTSGISLCQTET